jgi:hypothetical protein
VSIFGIRSLSTRLIDGSTNQAIDRDTAGTAMVNYFRVRDYPHAITQAPIRQKRYERSRPTMDKSLDAARMHPVEPTPKW